MATKSDPSAVASLERDALLKQACETAQLGDFGNRWFIEPMDKFIAASNREGRLTPTGRSTTSGAIVRGLVNRLRMIDDIKRHPEILDEKVEVAGIILGLPRTGSTLFQRLLASAPGMTAIRWFEAQNFAPFPGEEHGQPAERRNFARAMIDGWLSLAPELASIHPLDPDAPDEEILILGQMFVSTMVEGMNFVPSFAAWLNDYDQSQGHVDLELILKYLQWQDPSRRGSKWILKSPSNLPYAIFAARAFPEALLIMTHRDPLQTVPSYVSMQAALYKLSASLSDREVGQFWFPRLVEWMRLFEDARTEIGESRFIDIDYREVGRDPISQAKHVLDRMGVRADDYLDSMLREFIAGNQREQRPMHVYAPERFGLDEEAIIREFRAYRERFIL